MKPRRRGRGEARAGWLPLAILSLLLPATSAAGLSGANFEAASANRGTELVAARDWVPPVTSLVDPGFAIRGTVQLVAEASDPYGSGIASVRIERRLSEGGSWTTVCTDTVAPYACALDTTALANDFYDLRATATDNAGFVATDTVAEVQVDNRAPTVVMGDPGSPLSGIVTLSAEASDADSGVASVTIQRSPAGKASWTEVCAPVVEPYSCRFDTRTVAEGLYDFRAIALDEAGNSKTSSVVASRRIDNSVSSVSLEDPGAYLRGTVTLSANATSGTGVASVTIQRSPAGKSTWTEVCRDTTAPYACSWNTTTVVDGPYDLHAVMVTGSGAVVNSATISARQVDNTAVRGIDVQSENRAAGTAGRLESGDTLTLAYSEQMKPASILAGWSGSAPAPIYVRLRDGALLGTGSSGDTLQLSSDSAGNSPLGLGSVNLHGNFIKSGKTAVFAATLGASTQVVGGVSVSVYTVTLGSLVSGGSLRTASSGQMVWAPSATASDLAGNPSSTALVYEPGSLDRDF
jgi:hypothetical protein